MGFMTRRNMIQRAAVRAALCGKKAPVKVVEPVQEEKPNKELTREKVQSMPFFKVKSVAQANGIDVADKKTAELRSEVIKVLGL